MNRMVAVVLVVVVIVLAAPAQAILRMVVDKPTPPAAVPVSTATLATLAEHDSRLDALADRQRVADGKIAAAAQAATVGPIVVYRVGTTASVRTVSASERAVHDAKLAPRVRLSLARIDAHDFDARDVGMVLAGYRTMNDLASMGRFCRKILSAKYDLSFQSGLKSWTIGQCSDSLSLDK